MLFDQGLMRRVISGIQSARGKKIKDKDWIIILEDVKALAFKDKIGDKTVGVVVPGTHDFGIFDGNTETIVVTSGVLIISGKRLEVGDKYIINKGDHIVFEATDYASYLCIKG